MRIPSIPLATIVIVAALPLLLRSAIAEEPQAPALTVSLVTPTQREWLETVPASGWLKPWHEAIIASEIGGLRITEVLSMSGPL